MNPTQRIRRLAGCLALAGAAIMVVAQTADGNLRAPVFKPVISKPVAVPATPVAGKRFSVSFAVRRSDTRAPLRSGKMICDPAVAGKVIPHAESFTGGTARLSFVIPATAEGQTLVVNLTIKAKGTSAHRVARFPIAPAPKPALTIADASVEEGNAGMTTLSFPVTLSAASRQTITPHYATADGTAIAGIDYIARSGTVTFAPGDTATTITIEVVGDIDNELNETFTVTLSSPFNATITSGTATGTIVEDELVLVSPASHATVPQNVSTIGCPPNPTYGYGDSITFAWRTNHRPDIAAFGLLVQHRGAALPLVNVVLSGAESTSYTYRSCNGFVADANLDGWEWTVKALDSDGNTVAWAQGTFAFAPCRLADGRACHAP